MKRFLMRYAWAFFLGAGPDALFGYSLYTWQWWAFVMPMLFLLERSVMERRP